LTTEDTLARALATLGVAEPAAGSPSANQSIAEVLGAMGALFSSLGRLVAERDRGSTQRAEAAGSATAESAGTGDAADRPATTDADAHGQMLADLRRCREEIGRRPSRDAYDAWSPGRGYSSTTIRHRFGNWRAAVAAAFAEPDPAPVIPRASCRTNRDRAVADLRRCREELGRVPKSREYIAWKTGKGVSMTALQHQFGTWRQALAAAFGAEAA
jgi:hypothetical protein